MALKYSTILLAPFLVFQAEIGGWHFFWRDVISTFVLGSFVRLAAILFIIISLAMTAKANQALGRFSLEYLQFLCSQAPVGDRLECTQHGQRWLERSMAQLRPGMTVKDLRPLILGFTADPEFRVFVERGFFMGDTSESTVLRKKIWDEYNVLLLDGGIQTPLGKTQRWTPSELHLLDKGFRQLSAAVRKVVGASRLFEFSHVWGAGGTMARLGKLSIAGQFGEIYSEFPFQVNVVVNVAQANFKEFELAQRIAHENAHSQDYILGSLQTGQPSHWSETAQAQVFHACALKAEYETSLMPCRLKNPSWFSFHPTKYAAYNSAEFYGKMMDAWVRENLNLTTAGSYRCQNSSTRQFWSEFERNFIGESVSPSCR